MKSAALDYLNKLGKPIIPLCWPEHGEINPNHRENCESKGKRPLIAKWQRFCNELPTEEEVINWFSKWPEANIGGPTGPLWGIALDIDPRHGGDEQISLSELPDTVTNITGGGGYHYLFEHPGFSVANKVSLKPGVDVRGDGGQIVLPPSIHASGKKYEWEVSGHPLGIEVAPAPSWLLTGIRNSPGEPNLSQKSNRWDTYIYEGDRNNSIASMAGELFARGMKLDEVSSICRSQNTSRCFPPLNSEEVDRVVQSINKKHIADANLSEPWPPPLHEAAFHGLAGRVVDTISPHTEADKAALLLNFLAYYGNAVGNGPHAVAEGARHGTNLFACIVGATSKGRKGSANSHIKRLFSTVLPEWESSCVKSGLSSGEGLIYHVRDSTYKTNTKEEEKLVDKGIDDKRLLVIESEFASSLKVMNREGNILSATLRQAWDSGTMTQLIKNNPTKATDAHVSLIGHISKEELLRYLKDVEQANGFANRFIWWCSKRERLLPEGGGIPPYHELGTQLLESIDTAQGLGQIERDKSAKAFWAEVYGDLSTGKPGLSGAVLNRAEAQVLRLSVLYAAIDGSPQINLPHLNAALAVWEYSESSSEFIFGKSSGSAHGERILGALQETPAGMSRTAISHIFSGNVSSDILESSLVQLQQQGVAEKQVIQTEGRPAEVWVAKSP